MSFKQNVLTSYRNSCPLLYLFLAWESSQTHYLIKFDNFVCLFVLCIVHCPCPEWSSIIQCSALLLSQVEDECSGARRPGTGGFFDRPAYGSCFRKALAFSFGPQALTGLLTTNLLTMKIGWKCADSVLSRTILLRQTSTHFFNSPLEKSATWLFKTKVGGGRGRGGQGLFEQS